SWRSICPGDRPTRGEGICSRCSLRAWRRQPRDPPRASRGFIAQSCGELCRREESLLLIRRSDYWMVHVVRRLIRIFKNLCEPIRHVLDCFTGSLDRGQQSPNLHTCRVVPMTEQPVWLPVVHDELLPQVPRANGQVLSQIPKG